jgi:hypothetical protein
MSVPLTTGDIARKYGVTIEQVRHLYRSGRLAPADRVGPYRVEPVERLPIGEAALREAGYLRSEKAESRALAGAALV